MLKKFALFAVISFISWQANAKANLSFTTHPGLPHTSAGFTVDETISPNSPQEYENYLFFNVGVSCQIESSNARDQFQVEILKGSGKVDGREYHAGENVPTIDAHSGQRFDILAKAHAKVRLTLLGDSTTRPITAHCSIKL